VAKSVFHKSVLYKEVLEALSVRPGRTYIDATTGGGGHTRGILEFGGKVLGIDVDPGAIKYVAGVFKVPLKEVEGRLVGESEKLTIVQGNFADLKRIAERFGVWEASGILFDLGVSSHQLGEAQRGFSFQQEGPLDMRMDPHLAVTAADLVNGLNEGELDELFSKYGEESAGRRLARAVVRARVKKKIETTMDLAEIVERVVWKRGKIHPATRLFQALRIAVNDELNNLKKGLVEATEILNKGGRLVVISFHSLEDRIVKNFFKERADLQVLTKKPIVPEEEEILANRKARSAKMRVAEKQSAESRK